MSGMNQGFYKNRQGIRLFYEKWTPAGLPLKGIVQIAHGMREFTGYYAEFCEALGREGYGAFVHDARGHGRTAGVPGSGEFRENAGDIGKNGVFNMVEDLAEINMSLHEEYPGVPVFLLGHSMGSVLARIYISRYGKTLNGVIYSGTAGISDSNRLAKILQAAEEESERLGRNAAAVEPPKLLGEFFSRRFQPVKTGYEYMSRDEVMVREAISTPYHAVPYRTGFFVDILRAMQGMDAAENIRRIPKELPILSVSGDMDPFGDFGEGVKELFALYRRHGVQNASFVLYHGGRHEMLRETNRRDVFRDIVRWLDSLQA